MSEERDNVIKLGIKTEDYEPAPRSAAVTEDSAALMFADQRENGRISPMDAVASQRTSSGSSQL
jgi:hypothetical protein